MLMNPINRINIFSFFYPAILIALLFLLQFSLYADEGNKKRIDSLERVVNTTKNDRVKFCALKELGRYSVMENSPKALSYINQSATLAKQLNDSTFIALSEFVRALYLDQISEKDSAILVYTDVSEKLSRLNKKIELAQCYSFIGGIIFGKGNYQKSIYWFNRSNEIAEGIKYDHLVTNNFANIGSAYEQMGDHPKSITFFQKALSLAEKSNDIESLPRLLLDIGAAYGEGPNQDYAMNYFKRCQEMASKLKDTVLLLDTDMYIANNYYYNKKYDKAIEIYNQISKIAEKQHNNRSYAGALGNLGNVFADIGEFEKAQEYQLKAIEIFEKEEDSQGLTICYASIGSNYYSLKQYKKSIENYNKALKIATEMNSLEDLIEIHFGLSKTYKALNDYRNAYENYALYKQFNDSVNNTGNTKKLTEFELNFRFQAQQKEQELVQKNKEILSDEKLKRQKLVSYSSIVGVVLLLLLVGIVYRSSTQRKKANKYLQSLNNEIQSQNNIIAEKNEEITGSINYAKRIQSSFLTSETYIKQCLSEHFIVFNPRDIVSGDFYWVKEMYSNLYLCTADCTGHGIPGAFMSLIGMSVLNEIIHSKNNLRHTDEILNELRRIIILALNPLGSTEEGKDGMDAVLCRYDFRKMELEYSAANNSFYVIRKGVLLEFKPDKMPVGKYILDEKPFTRTIIPIEKGDCIYTFSDGYADQFGGPKGKKFKYSKLKELLLSIHHLPMRAQEGIIKESFENWKGNLEQVDDICIVGIRV